MGIEDALDRIADALESMSNSLNGGLVMGDPDTIGLADDGTPDYDALVKAKDRDELLRLCGKKGITVPPRTTTAKLGEMLKAADAGPVDETEEKMLNAGFLSSKQEGSVNQSNHYPSISQAILLLVLVFFLMIMLSISVGILEVIVDLQ